MVVSPHVPAKRELKEKSNMAEHKIVVVSPHVPAKRELKDMISRSTILKFPVSPHVPAKRELKEILSLLFARDAASFHHMSLQRGN